MDGKSELNSLSSHSQVDCRHEGSVVTEDAPLTYIEITPLETGDNTSFQVQKIKYETSSSDVDTAVTCFKEEKHHDQQISFLSSTSTMLEDKGIDCETRVVKSETPNLMCGRLSRGCDETDTDYQSTGGRILECGHLPATASQIREFTQTSGVKQSQTLQCSDNYFSGKEIREKDIQKEKPAELLAGPKESQLIESSDLKTKKRLRTGEKPFFCDECGKQFSRSFTLKEHQRMHSGEKPFTCNECGKQFTRQFYLRTHQQSHMAEKPFTCNECGKCFKRRSYLSTHQQSHTGEKPFSCNECGTCFTRRFNLKIHQRSHTGEKPFSCNKCEKCFTRPFYLKLHQRSHSGEQPFICNECGTRFTQKRSLRRHQQERCTVGENHVLADKVK